MDSSASIFEKRILRRLQMSPNVSSIHNVPDLWYVAMMAQLCIPIPVSVIGRSRERQTASVQRRLAKLRPWALLAGRLDRRGLKIPELFARFALKYSTRVGHDLHRT